MSAKACRVCVMTEAVASIESLIENHGASSEAKRIVSTILAKVDINGNEVNQQESVCEKDSERINAVLNLFERILDCEEFYFKSIRDGTAFKVLSDEDNLGFDVCRSCLSPDLPSEPAVRLFKLPDDEVKRFQEIFGLKLTRSEALLMCQMCLKDVNAASELTDELELSEKSYYEAKRRENKVRLSSGKKKSKVSKLNKKKGIKISPAAKTIQIKGEDRSTVRNGFKCEVCGKISTTKSDLKKHLEGVHVKTKKFACDLCPKMFYQKIEIREHIERNHLKKRLIFSSSRPFRCSEQDCSKFFKTKIELDRHYRAHSDDRPYACWCKKAFKFKGQLEAHQQRHEKKGQSARSEEADEVNNSNVAGTSGEPDNQQLINGYPCSICNKLLSSKCYLQSHIDCVHSKIKKFSCDICLKKFSSKSYVKKHVIAVHTNVKIKCDFDGCKFSFKSEKSLKQHGKVHKSE